MGGLTFAKSGPDGSPLNVPRMSPEVYTMVASNVQSKLELIFRNVTIPRDAPGKLDFGDVDFLVEGDLCSWTPVSLKQTLGATHHVAHGATHSYAVPYPDAPDTYAQIDVEISPGNGTPASAELFEWTRFMKGDSDLMQIIGICHRAFGLTCTDKGFFVRVEEIEPYHRKKSMIFLTRDPSQAILFYGLDFAKHQEGFRNQEDLFDWIAKGRFFNRTVFENREEKANDRARQRKRPMYSGFVERYMPSHPEAGIGEHTWTRNQVLNEALATFNKHDEYRKLIEEHNTREQELTLWQRIKECIPLEGNPLASAVQGLKRWVDFKDGQPFVTSEPLKGAPPVWSSVMKNEDEVLEWVKQNWAVTKPLEKARAAAAKEAARQQRILQRENNIPNTVPNNNSPA